MFSVFYVFLSNSKLTRFLFFLFSLLSFLFLWVAGSKKTRGAKTQESHHICLLLGRKKNLSARLNTPKRNNSGEKIATNLGGDKAILLLFFPIFDCFSSLQEEVFQSLISFKEEHGGKEVGSKEGGGKG